MREALREERTLWVTDQIAQDKFPEDLGGFYLLKDPPVEQKTTADEERGGKNGKVRAGAGNAPHSPWGGGDSSTLGGLRKRARAQPHATRGASPYQESCPSPTSGVTWRASHPSTSDHGARSFDHHSRFSQSEDGKAKKGKDGKQDKGKGGKGKGKGKKGKKGSKGGGESDDTPELPPPLQGRSELAKKIYNEVK